MVQLTATELKVLNELSQVQDYNVRLGTIISTIIGSTAEEGTPVNAVNATGTLTISGVVKDGETVTIGSDVYEFLADESQSKSASTNIPVDISSYATKASVTLTMDTQPISGDTVTIGTKTYIFVPVGTDNNVGEISIGATLAEAQTNLYEAIAGTDGVNTEHPSVTATVFETNVMTITAKLGGVVGNAIVSTETLTAVTNIFSASTLTTGADCSATNAVTALVAGVEASNTQSVSATDGSGDTVVITADVAGVSGNTIATTAVMTNGIFGAATLTGGVDGTIAETSKFLMDESYLYVCLDGNAASQKNWRRVSIGLAY